MGHMWTGAIYSLTVLKIHLRHIYQLQRYKK